MSELFLAIFPSSQPNSNQTWTLTSGSHIPGSPGLLGFQSTRQAMTVLGAGGVQPGQGKCSRGSMGHGVRQLKQLHSSTHQPLEKQKGTPAGSGLASGLWGVQALLGTERHDWLSSWEEALIWVNPSIPPASAVP